MDKKQSLVAFENTQINIGFNNNEIEMNIEELAKAIGGNIQAIKYQLSRNPELQENEFSYLKKVDSLENGVIKRREKRFFTEQGIYEVTLLTRTEKAKRFRKFARELITKYRRNEIVVKTAIGAQTNQKLDYMVKLLKSRDEEIESFIEFYATAKEKFNKIDKMAEDIEVIKDTVDEVIETVNGLIDEVEEREDA